MERGTCEVKSEKRIVNNCGVPHGGTDFGKAAKHGLYCPCGERFPGVPGEPGQYARTPFPQHSLHASGFPAALPGKTKTPQVHRGAFLQSILRQSRRGGRPDGICRRSSVGVNRRVSKRQRRNPPPHRGQSPLWKNAVAPAMPSTSPLRRILGGGRLWGEPLVPYHI